MLKFGYLLLLVVAGLPAVAQLPQTAQTDLYFPHLADGGPPSDQWQSRFTFINPNNSPVAAILSTYSNTGGALTLDLGNGPTTQTSFTIPAYGTTVLQSRIASSVTVGGWALAIASLPLQANIAFRRIQNGTAKLELAAEPTLPSTSYRSVAAPLVGVAVANVYVDTPLSITATVLDGGGEILGRGSLTIAPLGHASFNLFQVPGVPAAFTGSVLITPQIPGQVLVAWANYSDSSGVISSLPDGRGSFPLSQTDQIINAFLRLVGAFQAVTSDFGEKPQLVISPENDANAINAHAIGGRTVQINLALAELISDSPSELAFIIGHELGHIYQQRTGKFIWNPEVEWDADQWGLTAELAAGYDPYAGAGAMGKLAMATATAGLQAQLIQNWEQTAGIDAHASFGTRINNLTTFVQQICATADLQSVCTQYKAVVHPHFPQLSPVPLVQPGPAIDALRRLSARPAAKP